MSFDRKCGLPLLSSFLLLLLTLVVYWPVLNCEFINYDDHQYVVGNSHVHGGLTLETCRWAFNIGYACNWHPLTWLSHMADCQLFGLDPRGHHLTNLLLHTANALLLFGMLRRMTGAMWRSAAVAALFAWHPLHVESVAWVAERKDLLSTFFFILTLWAYGRYARKAQVGGQAPPQADGQPAVCNTHRASFLDLPSSVFYALSLLFFALGLMSKPMLVTLPCVLLLMDYWPLRRLESDVHAARRRMLWPLFREKAPFFALSLASCVVTLVAQRRGGAVVPLQVIPFEARCWNAVVSWLRYAGKLVWPSDLAVIYPYVFQWPLWLIGLALAFLLGVTVLALKWRRSAPYFPVGWFWFLGTLLPVIGLVQVGEQAMADRYTYIPSIGFFIVICWAVPQLMAGRPLWRPALALGTVIALGACGWATRLQLACWRDGVSLFEHALAVTGQNAVAHGTLGLALMDKGRLAEAVAQYEAALRISPDYSLAHNNLGVVLARMGRLDEAIAHYETALRLNPRDAEAHFNLANALNPGFVDTYAPEKSPVNHRADAQKAREQYQAALAIHPKYVNAHVNWGNLELSAGNPEAAVSHYEDAIRLDPLAGLAHLNLGNALTKMGRTNDAIRACARAVEIEPRDTLARFRLANLLVSQGEFEKAIPHYQQVLKLAPRHFVASCNLGSALAKLGKYQEASACFAEAIRIQPDYPDAHANLGKFLALQGNLDGAVRECSEAVRLRPDEADFHRQLALLLAQQGKMQEAVAHFSAVVRITPNEPGAHYDLGVARVKLGQGAQAVEQFREALRLKPSWIPAMNNLAWILATHERKEVRNGEEAVSLATRACVLTGREEAHTMGTLAAAYAEVGRFAEAVQTAQRTCELARAAGDKDLADKAEARLKLYQAGKPFHEAVGAGPQ